VLHLVAGAVITRRPLDTTGCRDAKRAASLGDAEHETAAERKRRLARERQHKRRSLIKAGLYEYRVRAREHELAEALIRSERLGVDEAQSVRRTQRALEGLIAEFTDRWLDVDR
jgi:hypothetical protein